MKQVKYKFYPSILDKFQSFVDTTAEDYFYQDENGGWHRNYNDTTGEYHFSEAEVYELTKKELIDAINRVGFVSAAATKGTIFNELVDALIHNQKCDIKTTKIYDNDKRVVAIEAELDGFTFMYDINLLKEAAAYFKDSLSQVHTSATIDTDYGVVELYGYIDELRKNKVYDIKTTSKYDFGKYSKYWQRHIYPYCLIESGACTEIESFEFTCYQLAGGTDKNKLITGKKYPEVYTYTHNQSKEFIKAQCERFIEFLEENRQFITDNKIFGGEKD